MVSDPVSKSLEWSKKGYMGMALLLMINEKPLTGYDIMRSIRVTTDGSWNPTPGGVYPVVKKLETEGLVHGEWYVHNGRKCKTYIITDNGKRTLESVLLKQSQIALGINRLFESFMKDIFGSESLFITRPSIFALLETESIKQELEELEAKRESVLELLDSLQRYLAGLDAKIAELKKESTF